MVTVLNEYNTRKEDINRIFSFLEDITTKEAILSFPTNGSSEKISIEQTAILKAELMLLFYNCVESTVSNCIRRILRAITDCKCLYEDLKPPIQETFLKSYWKRLDNRTISGTDPIQIIHKAVDVIIMGEVASIGIDEFICCNGQGVFSGSLDAKEIRNIFKLLDINLTITCDYLKIIKENRNKLAHGEIAFNECCRDFPITFFSNAKDGLFDYFDNLIKIVDNYIKNEEFKQ